MMMGWFGESYFWFVVLAVWSGGFALVFQVCYLTTAERRKRNVVGGGLRDRVRAWF